MLTIAQLNQFYGGSHILRDVSFDIAMGSCTAVLGRNGVGKTTLLKALMANAPGMPETPENIDAGSIRWGHEVSVGYFPQDATGLIKKGMTAVDWLHQWDPDAHKQDIFGLLGQMLFAGEETMKPTDALSGGETARLLFCRIMLQKPNVLIFDEPTNHLDLESINALNIALQKYEGTVLLVTHDEDLADEVGTSKKEMAETLDKFLTAVTKHISKGTKVRIRGLDQNDTLLNGDTFLSGLEAFRLGEGNAKQTNSPCIRSAGSTFYTPGNPIPAGQCITQVRVGSQNIDIPDPLGTIGSPTETRTVRPHASHPVPLIATGTSGTPKRWAK